MTNDLISRSALLEKLRFAEEHGNGFGLAFPIELVEVSPAVDAVEVVRCRDCKWYHSYGRTSLLVGDKNVKAGWCNRRIRYGEEHRMLPDDFCSYGERRADDGRDK